MLIKQISVFLENKKGRLADVTKVLGDNNINISALSIADTTDFGILRIIVNKPDEAEKILTENGFTVSITDVIAILVNNVPGGLAKELEKLDKNGIAIEYMYGFIGRGDDKALIVLRVENATEAAKTLYQDGVNVVKNEELFKL